MLRHMILVTLRSYRKKFSAEYGEMVICCDNKNYWRKKIFLHYKAKRREDQDKSEMDWNAIYRYMSAIKQEIKDNFRYPVIEVDGVEADDIIATMVMNDAIQHNTDSVNILILSRDKDFIQLHRFPHVKQFDPISDTWVKNADPIAYLKEHIIRGDRGDGIPSFLSPDDVFITGTRQKSITKAKFESWMKQKPEEFCDETTLKYYKRNQALIDLTKIPDDIHNSIMAEYINQLNKPKGNLMEYFMKHKLKNLMGSIGDF